MQVIDRLLYHVASNVTKLPKKNGATWNSVFLFTQIRVILVTSNQIRKRD